MRCLSLVLEWRPSLRSFYSASHLRFTLHNLEGLGGEVDKKIFVQRQGVMAAPLPLPLPLPLRSIWQVEVDFMCRRYQPGKIFDAK